MKSRTNTTPKRQWSSIIGDGSYLIDARLGIDELGALIGADLPDEEWDTVGGLVLGLAGRVPKEGEDVRDREPRLHR